MAVNKKSKKDLDKAKEALFVVPPPKELLADLMSDSLVKIKDVNELREMSNDEQSALTRILLLVKLINIANKEEPSKEEPSSEIKQVEEDLCTIFGSVGKEVSIKNNIVLNELDKDFTKQEIAGHLYALNNNKNLDAALVERLITVRNTLGSSIKDSTTNAINTVGCQEGSFWSDIQRNFDRVVVIKKNKTLTIPTIEDDQGNIMPEYNLPGIDGKTMLTNPDDFKEVIQELNNNWPTAKSTEMPIFIPQSLSTMFGSLMTLHEKKHEICVNAELTPLPIPTSAMYLVDTVNNQLHVVTLVTPGEILSTQNGLIFKESERSITALRKGLKSLKPDKNKIEDKGVENYIEELRSAYPGSYSICYNTKTRVLTNTEPNVIAFTEQLESHIKNVEQRVQNVADQQELKSNFRHMWQECRKYRALFIPIVAIRVLASIGFLIRMLNLKLRTNSTFSKSLLGIFTLPLQLVAAITQLPYAIELRMKGDLTNLGTRQKNLGAAFNDLIKEPLGPNPNHIPKRVNKQLHPMPAEGLDGLKITEKSDKQMTNHKSQEPGIQHKKGLHP